MKTNRLVLRKIMLDDFDDIFLLLGDSQVMYAWGHGFSVQEVREWIDKNLLRYENDGFSYLFATEKHTGAFVGVVGLLIETIDEKKSVGIGYIFKKEFWGRGYATEGAKACIDYCFKNNISAAVIADIRPENTSSIKLAKSLGMQEIGRHEKVYKGNILPHIIFEIKKCDFL